MGSTKTTELSAGAPSGVTPSTSDAATQQDHDGLQASPSTGAQQRQLKRFVPFFRLEDKQLVRRVNRLAGFNMARVQNRMARWLRSNKGDPRAKAVRDVLIRLVHAEEMFGPETYGKARWSAGTQRGLAGLQRLRPYLDVRQEEERYLRGRILYGGERQQRRVEQFARAQQLVEELTGLLGELAPKFDEQGRKVVAHLFRVPGVLNSRPPDARYLAVTQKRLREAGLKYKEIARLFARAKADDIAITVEAERIRVRIRALNAEDRKEGGAPLLRWSGALVGFIVSPVMRDTRHARLSMHDQRRVCVEAPCDPRTLRKYLDGQPIRPMAMASIKRALKALGFELEAEPSPAVR